MRQVKLAECCYHRSPSAGVILLLDEITLSRNLLDKTACWFGGGGVEQSLPWLSDSATRFHRLLHICLNCER